MNLRPLHVSLLSLGLVLIGWGAAQGANDIHTSFSSVQADLAPQVKIAVATAIPITPTAYQPVVKLASPSIPTPAGPTRVPIERTPGPNASSADTFLGSPDALSEPSTAGGASIPAVQAVPDRIVIPAIHLDAPIIPAVSTLVELGGQWYPQWLAPDQLAAGWHTSSAGLGDRGNMVLNGHHNEFGEVFSGLVILKPGDEITIYAGSVSRRFRVANVMILPERDQPLAIRLENARWLAPTADERLTLVTCWPKRSNTHRLIIVASPE
jgi:LPXTG-site transpeptidase (sortase) family protein